MFPKVELATGISIFHFWDFFQRKEAFLDTFKWVIRPVFPETVTNIGETNIWRFLKYSSRAHIFSEHFNTTHIECSGISTNRCYHSSVLNQNFQL